MGKFLSFQLAVIATTLSYLQTTSAYQSWQENEYLSNDELSTGVGIVVGVTRGNSLATKSTKNDCSSADYNYIESASLSHCGLTRVRANLPYSENSCA